MSKNLKIDVDFKAGAEPLAALTEARNICKAAGFDCLEVKVEDGFYIIIRPDSNISDLHEIFKLKEKLLKLEKTQP